MCKDTCTPMFTAALFTVAKTWEQPKCPLIDDRIKTTWYMCTMGYYSAMRKDEILPFATTWMDLENIVLRKISQEQLRTIWFHSYVGNKTETAAQTTVGRLPERREVGGCFQRAKGTKYRAAEDDVTLGGGHTMKYTDHTSQKWRRETYIILLSNLIPIHLI